MALPPPRRRRILYVLEAPLRRRALVLAPVVLFSLAAAAIGYLQPPRYRAAALLGAEWDAAAEALVQSRGIDPSDRRNQAVRQRVTDRAVLQRALREASPYAAPGEAGLPLDQQIERLLSDLRVRPMATSSYVIEFVHRDPARAAALPNLLARQLTEPAEPVRPATPTELLEARLDEARRVLKQKADALARVAPKAPQPGNEDFASDEETFAERRSVAASLATARARAERLQQEIEAETRSGRPPTPEAELERLRGDLAELRRRYTEEHPDVEKLRRQIQRLEASLPRDRSGAPSPWAQLRATQAEIEELMARQAQLEASTSAPARTPKGTLRPAPADPARDRAVREHERARQEYQRRLEEWQAAETAARLRGGPIARFELLRAAAIPEVPESPSPVLYGLAGAFVGLLTGLVAAVVAEQRDRSVKGPEDLEDILPVPLLATLPEVRGAGRAPLNRSRRGPG